MESFPQSEVRATGKARRGPRGHRATTVARDGFPRFRGPPHFIPSRSSSETAPVCRSVARDRGGRPLHHPGHDVAAMAKSVTTTDGVRHREANLVSESKDCHFTAVQDED